MIALLCSYLMISISPIFNETMTVVATTYHMCDWDDVNVQNDYTGYTGSILSRYQKNYWDIKDDAARYYSAPRCLYARAGRSADSSIYSEGHIYLTVNRSYIGTTYLYFSTDESDAAGTPEYNHFMLYFYAPNGTEVLRVSIGDQSGGTALHGFECLDATGTQQRIYTSPKDWDIANFDEFCLVITHLYGNTMQYAIYNWSGDLRGSTVASCRTAYDWQSWGHLYIDGDQGNNNGGAIYMEAWFDDIYVTDDSFPSNPYDANIILHNQTTHNISWTEPGTLGIDNYTIVGQYGAWPTDAYDGIEFFNGTGNSTLDVSYNYNYYYKIFSYNLSYNIYSTGVPLYWSAAEFNVFNGTDYSRINFTLDMTRLDASYYNDTCNDSGPFVYSLIGGVNGTNCRLTISNSSFTDSIFYEDMILYSYYRFYIYMFDDAQPAYITVIDKNGAPLSNALIDVSRFINGTYTYIASDLTDSSGESMFWLVHNISHQFNITLENYELDGSPFWTPTPGDNTKTFIMTYTYTNVTPVTPADCINLRGTMYENGSIYISYTDRCGNTTNANFTLGNIYNGTFSVNATNSTTNNNTWGFWETNVNISRIHRCVLNANHTQLGYIHNYSIYIYPVATGRVNESWLETMFDAVLGDWDFGWVLFFLIYFPALLFIISFGSMGHPGLGVVGGGGWVLFVNGYVLFGLEATFALIGIILILLGIIAILGKKGRSLMQ